MHLPYELQRLVEGIGVFGARIEDDRPELEAGKDGWVAVDEVDGVKHPFEPLQTAVVDFARAPRFVALLMNRKQTSQHDVTVKNDRSGRG